MADSKAPSFVSHVVARRRVDRRYSRQKTQSDAAPPPPLSCTRNPCYMRPRWVHGVPVHSTMMQPPTSSSSCKRLPYDWSPRLCARLPGRQPEAVTHSSTVLCGARPEMIRAGYDV